MSSQPISGIYILNKGGIPLFARYYQGTRDKPDSTLLGGFFSAIEVFVKTSLDELLSDIGMTSRRFFFDRTESGHIIVIIVSTETETIVEQNTLNIVDSLKGTINNCFKILAKTSSAQMIDMGVLIEGLGSTIDSFVLESNFEAMNEDLVEDITYSVETGEDASEEFLGDIISEIEKN